MTQMELITEKEIDSTGGLGLFDFINRYTYILSQDTVNIPFSIHFNKSEYDFGKIQTFKLNPRNSSEYDKKAIIAKYT